jgi:glutamate dehydrogenase (NADP+)
MLIIVQQALDDIIPALAPLLDRAPKYAWIAKQLLEPERMIQFRVAWLDDNGNSRLNRGKIFVSMHSKVC